MARSCFQLLVAAFFATAARSASAPYSQLWLSYTPVSSAFRESLGLSSVTCNAGDSVVLQRTCAELYAGLGAMLQSNFTVNTSLEGVGISQLVVSVETGGSGAPVWPPSPHLEGYSITRYTNGTIHIFAHAAHGALNGAWRMLRLVQLEAPSLLVDGVVDVSEPGSPLRMWQLWDNFDGTIGRGNAGGSIVYPLSDADPLRVTDFARLLSSLGINAISWSNVNGCHQGNEFLLNATNLGLLAPLAQSFHEFGIHSVLVPCWSSPQIVGGLNSSDPRDPRVTAWWRSTLSSIHDAFGGGVFRGFLFKGDTEGEPGPALYNLTEQEGANYFGSLLNSSGSICIWRSFSHPPNGHDMPVDQAFYQFQRFSGWDAESMPNVVLQIKNGPFDFQVREPVHALFGNLTRTSLLLELEVLPEYVGQNKHVTALATQWSSYFSFDLGTPSSPVGPCNATVTTLAGVVSGGSWCNAYSGVAGVSNLGLDSNWTGHLLNGANTFGFGRLAWAPTLPAPQVHAEWAGSSFPGSVPEAVGDLVALLGDSWEAYENFTASLGWGFICGGDHYKMDPPLRVDYTNASQARVGYARGLATAYGGAYNGGVADAFLSLDACPEELLLAFHNVPYTHILRGGRYGGLSVLDWIYSSHAAGATTSAGFVPRWQSLAGRLNLSAYAVGGETEDGIFAQLTLRLQSAATDAAIFSQNVSDYFEALVALKVAA